ncbi:high-affinity branched-chain amino acid ABC transporter permease LivM [Ancylobacter sp. 6x-1]|uniref:High-affinity branched-chain amino acid ABC transporter permease LivM n=1 Tax=Ancylobacter crimeensis TaxID=2579147 RepID=A0ABT0DFT8_9HYPH|nr:high-affinity branched-chain amino acid ABC transporter permease LivM [Ancylobacter crimeensis]MCK0198820.1 high-affinity branched-chain amino acid ABC transporter permease LivM [Ancylobacter crimeensis]
MATGIADSAAGAPAGQNVLGDALKDAFFAGLITLGLIGPLVGFQTVAIDTGAGSVLGLAYRPVTVAIMVGIVFIGRLILNLTIWSPNRVAKTRSGPTVFDRIGTAAGPAVKPLLLAFAIGFPFLATLMMGGMTQARYLLDVGILILTYVMLGWGLNIVVGLAGLLDLGYVAFYAVGAYTYALLATSEPVTHFFGGLLGETFWANWAFWICLPVAGLFAGLWGMILGFPVLRLRGDYLAIVTLAFGEIIRLVLINWVDFTGGGAGIASIPRATFFGIPFTAGEDGFAARFGLEFSPMHRIIFLYFVILALALITAFATVRLRKLPVGRAWEALREDEIACRSLGINTTNVKLSAFATGAMFGGFAGCFFAVRAGFVSPESFTFDISAMILAIVVLGGMGSQIGVAVAAAVMMGGMEALRNLDFLKQVFGQDFDPALYRMLIFGFAMVSIMVWKPRGLVSTREPTIFLKERKAVSGDLVKEGHG